MVVIHMVALAKLNIIMNSHRSSTSPVTAVVSCLVLPFLFKASLESQRFRRGYSDLVHSLRLFFFQLSRIAFPRGDDDDDRGRDRGRGRGRGRVRAADTRWERTVRLVRQSVISGVRSPVGLVEEDSFHTLFTIAL